MKTPTKVVLGLSAGAATASVWAPGDWWKWLITAFILLVAAAALDQ